VPLPILWPFVVAEAVALGALVVADGLLLRRLPAPRLTREVPARAFVAPRCGHRAARPGTGRGRRSPVR
jgi:hypothetical protein